MIRKNATASRKVSPVLELADRVAAIEVERQKEKDDKKDRAETRCLLTIISLGAIGILMIGYFFGQFVGREQGYDAGYHDARIIGEGTVE